jgi:glyceraldehyde 3-phosphate dehydrogenase
MSINVAINGFGRIGKCCFLQMMDDARYNVCAINALNVTVDDIEDYLRTDSIHGAYNRAFVFTRLGPRECSINHHRVRLFSERDASNIDWRAHKCEYLIEATGAYLTTDECSKHNIDYVVISAPAKDRETPTYVYGVNHTAYRGETIISNASCTTNCVAPMLKLLDDSFDIQFVNFTTIHATTSSQSIADRSIKRRSIFNNILPYTTGASSAIAKVLPELKDKIIGTSVRVPVSNGSIVDLNIDFDVSQSSPRSLDQIKKLMQENARFKQVFDVKETYCTSSDILTTTTPVIWDISASMDAQNGKVKLFLWYDNEWSYASQVLRMIDTMSRYNSIPRTIPNTVIGLNHFIEHMDLTNKRVVCRFDYNVPIIDGQITDTFRIESTRKTVKYVLEQNPTYLLIVSHLGRPKHCNDVRYSLRQIVPHLENMIGRPVVFLEHGLSEEMLVSVQQDVLKTETTPVFLLENIRYCKDETEYEGMSSRS